MTNTAHTPTHKYTEEEIDYLGKPLTRDELLRIMLRERQLTADAANAEARVAELSQERDSEHERAELLASRNADARARVAELEAVLRKIADAADYADFRVLGDAKNVHRGIRILSEVQHARAVLAKETK